LYTTQTISTRYIDIDNVHTLCLNDFRNIKYEKQESFYRLKLDVEEKESEVSFLWGVTKVKDKPKLSERIMSVSKGSNRKDKRITIRLNSAIWKRFKSEPKRIPTLPDAYILRPPHFC